MTAPPLALRQLHHLTVFSDLFAETPGGNVYAIRPDLSHNWRLVSRTDAFDALSYRSVEECDAWLTVWLVNR